VKVGFEVKDHVATITLNRPEKHNAMDNEMYEAISSHLGQIDSDDDIWVGVITGAGQKAFTAGADLVGMHGTAEKAEVGWTSPRPKRFDLGLEVQKPLIAAVNGYCLAGGLELALVCDIRVASEGAQFGCPEVKWNLLHGYGAQLLPRIVSHAVVHENTFDCDVAVQACIAREEHLTHAALAKDADDEIRTDGVADSHGVKAGRLETHRRRLVREQTLHFSSNGRVRTVSIEVRDPLARRPL